MKSIKSIVFFLTLIALIASLESCKKCKKENPRARITNNSNSSVSVQIMTTGGNTVNINNIAPGSTSDYANYAAGLVTFTVKITGVDYVKSVEMELCYEYDIVVDANNNITSIPFDRNSK